MSTESNNNKKYQVFVSATCDDLREERQRLAEALLAAGCIPVGLELCPRDASLEQANAIKALIDECDYYLILVGGRYGSLAPTGISYTHREFIYAQTKRKPMASLIHEHPESLPQEKRERTAEGVARLRDFKELVARGTLVRPWNQVDDLKGGIQRLLAQLVKTHPAPGWVRGSQVADLNMARENQELRRQVEELRKELDQFTNGRAVKPEVLARGSDLTAVTYSCNVYIKGNCIVSQARTQLTWDTVFATLAPTMMNEVTEDQMRQTLAARIAENALKDVAEQHKGAHAVRDIVINPVSFNTIKMHFRAMGYIRKGTTPGPGNQPTWQITPQGDQYMVGLLAVRRQP
ncbi:MAG: DUF4062 domain-containing protein [Pseudomonadota bacterium]